MWFLKIWFKGSLILESMLERNLDSWNFAWKEAWFLKLCLQGSLILENMLERGCFLKIWIKASLILETVLERELDFWNYACKETWFLKIGRLILEITLERTLWFLKLCLKGTPGGSPSLGVSWDPSQSEYPLGVPQMLSARVGTYVSVQIC